MGAKMMNIYNAIKEKGGMAAQMRLVMFTGIAMQQAKDAADTPEMLNKLAVAFKEITNIEWKE
jgi:hypothetical protein